MNITKSARFGARQLVLVLSVLLSLALTPCAVASEPAGLVIFGDSLSDSGNHFVAYGTIAHQPFVPDPVSSYAIGGHHFSNGATWAEQLATDLHLATSGKPALRQPGKFTNYAVGRARARVGAPGFPDYDLSTQVNLFLSDFGGQASSGNLYMIWIGGNDLQDALYALAVDPSGNTSTAILQAAVTAVATNVTTLWAHGATNFLILSLADPAITPLVRALGPAAQAAATSLAGIYNTVMLGPALDALEALPGVQLLRLDINAVFEDIVADPEAVGLTNVDDSCLAFSVIGHAICSTPNRYLFWDGVHPTTAAHGALAEAALQLITTAP